MRGQKEGEGTERGDRMKQREERGEREWQEVRGLR